MAKVMRKFCTWILLFTSLIYLFTMTSCAEESRDSVDTSHQEVKVDVGAEKQNTNQPINTETDAVKLYRKLLQQKRSSQKEAVQTMVNIGAYDKQKKMISAVITKIFTVLEKSRMKLTEAGYTPTDPFPTDEKTKDALSSVLENVAFLGDIVLRLPDITHSLIKKNQEWKLLIEWGVGFCNDTTILTGNDAQLLNLMAQEFGLVERDPNYINPYRADTIKAQEDAKRKLKADSIAAMKKAEKERKRKEKKKERGPRMSGPRHSEL